MKVVVFGLGYVGFTAMCCIASEGSTVVGIDVSERKVGEIRAKVPPIVEPGLEAMLAEGVEVGRITAATEIGSHLDDADLAIVCVGTPSAQDGSHNMDYIANVSRQIAEAVSRGGARQAALSVAFRSTVRPGTMEELVWPIFRLVLGDAAERDVEIVYNPEFLREGSAVKDYFEPPKIVIGTKNGQPSLAMERLNANIDAPVFVVPYRESEITKFVDNTWHAVKVTFANEIGRACLNLGVSAKMVHEIFVSDTKLNVSPYYLRPGGAFGGSCLPKDVRALQHLAADSGASLQLVDSLIRSNEAHKHRIYEYAVDGLEPGAKILLAGVAFKAGTDDLRESPNVDLARKLLGAGYDLEIFDPAVDASKLIGANLGYVYKTLPALEKILVGAEHAETTHYDRVLAANATVSGLMLGDRVDVRSIGELP
ncbi:MAG: nucleotide sugar dehydrogenase [Pseudomonadota bacterium]